MTARTANRPRSAGALLGVVLLAIALAGCMPAEERTFFDRTNSLRSAHGIPKLNEHDVLTKKAEDWARHMAATRTLAHSNLSAGLGNLRWTKLGENVGYSSPTSNTLLTLHNMLAASTKHRANMLDRQFTHMGVGVAKSSDGRVWVVEVFARL